LQGHPLTLAGPTFDGGYIDLERDRRGKIVLVVFWDTATPECRELLPQLSNLHGKYASRGLEIVGVSLDDDERALEAALDEQAFPGPTIFHAHQKLRRWDNPIVKYYGVREIPMLWLVDRDGQVVSTQLDPAHLEATLERLCSSP
jgi:peroxiredoxin